MLKMMFGASWLVEMAVVVGIAALPLLVSHILWRFCVIRLRCNCVNDSSWILFWFVLRLLLALCIKVACGLKLFGSNLLGEKEHGKERVFESNMARGSTALALSWFLLNDIWLLFTSGATDIRFGELRLGESSESRDWDVEDEADDWSQIDDGRLRCRIGLGFFVLHFSKSNKSFREFFALYSFEYTTATFDCLLVKVESGALLIGGNLAIDCSKHAGMMTLSMDESWYSIVMLVSIVELGKVLISRVFQVEEEVELSKRSKGSNFPKINDTRN